MPPELEKALRDLVLWHNKLEKSDRYIFEKDIQLLQGRKILGLGQAYPGSINADGTTVFLPDGWSVVKTSSGVYVITHNLNITDAAYSVFTELVGANLITIPNITAKDENTFTLDFYNQTGSTSWSATDTAFDFTLIVP